MPADSSCVLTPVRRPPDGWSARDLSLAAAVIEARQDRDRTASTMPIAAAPTASAITGRLGCAPVSDTADAPLVREARTEPEDWWESTDPEDWCESTEANDIEDPTENAERNEPTEHTDPHDPTLPIDSTEPSDHSDSSESREPSDQRDVDMSAP